MNSNVKDSVNYAFSGKLSDMSDSLDAAIKEKLSGALEQKKVEISKSLLGGTYSEQVSEDINESTEESFEDLLETLSPEMGAEKYIHDFVHSDNPKFEGKSKKERIQMALGAYYSAKKGKARNEEVESFDEAKPSAGLSKKEKSEIAKKAKAGKDIGKKGKGFSKVEDAAAKYGATDPKAVATAVMWKNVKRKK